MNKPTVNRSSKNVIKTMMERENAMSPDKLQQQADKLDKEFPAALERELKQEAVNSVAKPNPPRIDNSLGGHWDGTAKPLPAVSLSPASKPKAHALKTLEAHRLELFTILGRQKKALALAHDETARLSLGIHGLETEIRTADAALAVFTGMTS